jgi:hypothetical protein
MAKLLLVSAPGLTPEQACRGDLAANLSDLIADGSFAAVSAGADLRRAAESLGADKVATVVVPFRDMPSFDEEIGRLRAEGVTMAIVSESVFISQRCFREIRPGATLAPSDVERLLAAMAGA